MFTQNLTDPHRFSGLSDSDPRGLELRIDFFFIRSMISF